MKPPPSIDEILALLQALEKDQKNGGKTSYEWSQEWGFGKDKTRFLLKKAILAGKMQARNIRIDDVLRPGRKCSTTVYEWVGE